MEPIEVVIKHLEQIAKAVRADGYESTYNEIMFEVKAAKIQWENIQRYLPPE